MCVKDLDCFGSVNSEIRLAKEISALNESYAVYMWVNKRYHNITYICVCWTVAWMDPLLSLSHLPCSAFEPYQKINWQTAGVGFRTGAQVADGIARSGATD